MKLRMLMKLHRTGRVTHLISCVEECGGDCRKARIKEDAIFVVRKL